MMNGMCVQSRKEFILIFEPVGVGNKAPVMGWSRKDSSEYGERRYGPMWKT